MPTPIATYFVQLTPQNTTTLTTASFTPSNGEHLVVKLGTWDSGSPLGAPTGGSQTYTSRVINAPGGFNQWCAIYSATISGSPGSMAVSSVPSVSLRGSMLVERWPAGSLAGSPVTASSSNFGAPVAGSITPSAGTSAISWVGGDVGSADPATRAYVNSGTDEAVRDDHVGSNGVDYYGYQQATGTSSQSYGLTLPASTTFVIAGIEILATGGATPIVDPTWAPHRLVPPGRISPAGFWVPWSGDAGVGGVVLVVLGDAGSEAEALAVAAALALADTASAAEALTVVVTVALADSAAGADSLIASAAVPLADSASAADALSVATAVPLADSGSATDSVATAATVALADAGSASEGLSVTATVPLADTGSAVDALDNGTGTSKALADAGASSEALSVAVTAALADVAAAAEALTIAAAAALADAAAATQAITITATTPLADTATAGQALTATATLALADTGAAGDAGTGADASSTPKALADSGAATERIHARVVRPSSGTTTRPNSGTTTRPYSGTTLWP